MPKKTNISSNQRVDKEDYLRGANEYTQEMVNFHRSDLWLSRSSLVAGGFRVEVTNAASGEITIYNGLGVDRNGRVLNNEDQANDSRTLTLTGTSTSFFVEVEYVESESDVAVRAFWDPTFSGNTPPGREFTTNVATRISQDWQVVTPVRTDQFSVDENAASARIPVAVITTDPSNVITGISLVNAATILERDASGSSIRVLDTTIFPDSFTADLVGATTEEITVTGVNRDTNILTLSGAISGTFGAGTIIREKNVSASFAPNATTPAPSSGTDRRVRLFGGDEERGAALMASTETFGDQDDTEVRSLKDYVDFLAAELRQLKFGNPRSEEDNTAPPSSFTSTRYFDNAGSVAGARTATVSVGDGVTSYGDFNSTNLTTALTSAHAALDATNGGSIFVKQGSYVWGSGIFSITRPVFIEFGTGVVLSAGTYTSFSMNITSADPVEIIGFPAPPTGTDALAITSGTTAVNLTLRDSTLRLDMPNAGTTNSSLYAKSCTLEGSFGEEAVLLGFTTAGDSAVFEDCTIQYNDTVADTNTYLVDCDFADAKFVRCVFDLIVDTAGTRGFVSADNLADHSRLSFIDCSFQDTGVASANTPLDFDGSSGYLFFDNCVFDVNWDSVAATTIQRTLLFCDVDETIVQNCNFRPMAQTTIGNTSLGNEGRLIHVDSGGGVVRSCQFGRDPALANSLAPHFVSQVSIGTTIRFVVSDNVFETFYKAVTVGNNCDVIITDNRFETDTNGTTPDKSCYGVFAASSGELQVANNQFELELLDGDGSYEAHPIHAVSVNECLIRGNTVRTRTDLDEGVGIYVEETFLTGQVTITDNIIEGGSSNVSFATAHDGIRLLADDGNGFSAVVSNNRVTMDAQGTGTLVGINMLTTQLTTSAAAFSTVSGNLVQMSTSSTNPGVTGIAWRGNGVNITENSVLASGASGLTTSGNGILCKGHNINVANNHVHMNASGFDSAIYVEAATTGTIELAGSLSISGNNVRHEGRSPAIQVGIIDSNILNIDISTNNISWNGPVNYTNYTPPFSVANNPLYWSPLGIFVLSYLVDPDPGNVNIASNNLFVQTVPDANSYSWQGVFVAGYSSAGEGFPEPLDSVVITSNTIKGSSPINSFDTILSGAIRVEQATQLIISSNTVVGWSGNVGTVLLWAHAADSVSVVGNVLVQRNASVTDSIIIASGSGVAVGNVDIVGTGSITAPAGVLLDSGVYNALS